MIAPLAGDNTPQTAGPVDGLVHLPTGPVPDVTRAWAETLAQQIRGRLHADQADTAAPSYGSDDWHALHPYHPLRYVAMVNAAELWRHGVDDRPRQLEAELSAGRWAADRIDAQQFADLAAWVRATAGSPSHDELERRRSQTTRPAGYSPRPWPTGATA